MTEEEDFSGYVTEINGKKYTGYFGSSFDDMIFHRARNQHKGDTT